MPISMTGYGRSRMVIGGMEITVEVRSINHRYFDFSIRMPRAYAYLEEKLKLLTQNYMSRGKVDLYVSIIKLDGQAVSVSINRPLLEGHLAALKQIVADYGVIDDISASTLAKNSDIFNVVREDEDADTVYAAVKTVADDALTQFAGMRKAEGERLTVDLLERLDGIEAMLPEIEAVSAKTVVDYRERITALVKELCGEIELDYTRLTTETGLFADRISITEELVRLRSHIEEMRSMLKAKGAMGRKMDFLLQEMNREINTIGSKCQRSEIAMTVVSVKSELEKIREQVQNLE